MHTPIICNDDNACTLDSCDPNTGKCVYTPLVCTASDQCHTAGICDQVTGCSNPTAPNGTPCEDGNICSQNDSCEAGICTTGNVSNFTCAGSGVEDAFQVRYVAKLNNGDASSTWSTPEQVTLRREAA